jgi:hypothetical protein
LASSGEDYAIFRRCLSALFKMQGARKIPSWVINGSDFSFEGATAVHYNSIDIHLTEEE